MVSEKTINRLIVRRRAPCSKLRLATKELIGHSLCPWTCRHRFETLTLFIGRSAILRAPERPLTTLCVGAATVTPLADPPDTAAIRAVCARVCVCVCVCRSAGSDAAPCHDHRGRFTSFGRFLFSSWCGFYIYFPRAEARRREKRRVKRPPLHAGPTLKLAFVCVFTPRCLRRMLLRVKFTPTSKLFYITPGRNMRTSKYEILHNS